jgi:hypothetical protein
MKLKAPEVCDKQALASFLNKKLEEDQTLEFLFHLDRCSDCWQEVYSATKASHPHFYKKPPRKSTFSEKDLVRLHSDEEDTDEVFEVA